MLSRNFCATAQPREKFHADEPNQKEKSAPKHQPFIILAEVLDKYDYADTSELGQK